MTLSGKARVAGVMGWPVSHSRSPRLHGFWLEAYGIDGAYVPFAVRPEHLVQALGALPALGLAGVNLTVPHKEAALASLDEIEPLARRIGAVNTVVVDAAGRLVGSNTDVFGFMANLREAAPAWRADSGPGVVLGAGGAARAVCAGLLDAGVAAIRLVNRSPARAERLAHDLGGPITVRPWSERPGALEGATLVVNTTMLGMAGQPPLDLALDPVAPGCVVCDLVYVPLETLLLARARARGLVAVDGLGMLLHQARPGFAAWFGLEPEVTAALRDHVAAP
ncbi:MAG: shikimate dehydrogenase [Alphaproteobacteria bacterium]